jgi:GNAT superfamily N-acetyltransferase
MNQLVIRDGPVAGDVALVRRLAMASGGFSPSEVEIAVELIEERLRRGLASGYHFLFAEPAPGKAALGYACHGPIPLTRSSWDLYWIVVEKGAQGKGIGQQLLGEMERRAAALGASQVFIDASGRSDAARSAAFYRGAGYTLAASLADFYAAGDPKLIFVKCLISS